MPLTVEAIYANGVLKPMEPLPLKEHEKVKITVHPLTSEAQGTAGMIACSDPALIEWAATSPDLEYPSAEDMA